MLHQSGGSDQTQPRIEPAAPNHDPAEDRDACGIQGNCPGGFGGTGQPIHDLKKTARQIGAGKIQRQQFAQRGEVGGRPHH